MDPETEIKALQALRSTAAAAAARVVEEEGAEGAEGAEGSAEAAARAMARPAALPPAAHFGSLLGASRAELAAEKRRLIAAAGADGATAEGDGAALERHQARGGSGVVKKAEGDYQKKKYKFFRDKLAAAGELVPGMSSNVNAAAAAAAAAAASSSSSSSSSSSAAMAPPPQRKRRARWDATPALPGPTSGVTTSLGIASSSTDTAILSEHLLNSPI